MDGCVFHASIEHASTTTGTFPKRQSVVAHPLAPGVPFMHSGVIDISKASDEAWDQDINQDDPAQQHPEGGFTYKATARVVCDAGPGVTPTTMEAVTSVLKTENALALPALDLDGTIVPPNKYSPGMMPVGALGMILGGGVLVVGAVALGAWFMSRKRKTGGDKEERFINDV